MGMWRNTPQETFECSKINSEPNNYQLLERIDLKDMLSVHFSCTSSLEVTYAHYLCLSCLASFSPFN